MVRSVRLNDDDREFLRFLLASLHLTQRVFGDQAGVPQGWLSGVMSGKRPAVEPEMLTRMGSAAKELLEKSEIPGLDAEALEKGIAQVFRLRDEATRLIAPPGGAIPPYATNFIERHGMEAARGLLGRTSFTMSVEGGRGTGKTTFLKWLQEEAERRGFEVAFVDCGDFAPAHDFPDDQLPPQFDKLLVQLAEYLEEAWSLPPVSKDGMCFTNWWLRMRAPMGAANPRPRLLVLDRLTRLGYTFAEYLLKLVRNIHNSRHGVALSFGLGVDADIVAIKDDVRRSSAYSVVQPRILLGRFDERQIRRMLEVVCGDRFNPDWVHDVETLAKDHYCQPYFVHLAADFLQSNPSIKALLNEVEDPQGDFQPLWEMEQYIKHHEPVEPELKGAYRQVLAA